MQHINAKYSHASLCSAIESIWGLMDGKCIFFSVSFVYSPCAGQSGQMYFNHFQRIFIENVICFSFHCSFDSDFKLCDFSQPPAALLLLLLLHAFKTGIDFVRHCVCEMRERRQGHGQECGLFSIY